ncbi:NAD-dependent epimerase/dehydratase [Enhygromyxa salina]|uniref:NAD-dependent epimerase/dehydratase n=1 Tax=Enhygromyxa salina TaxID=215803 RepID=A0A0C2D535_9BACT|nr:NAD(P)H-binding protein [Enhygromyxa salina]KIG16800.1 NAD-dependent epimerase/dehydratase [Enhygromyxa salina]
MPGPVFIAGATGYTGREVVRESVARGLETVAHVRPDSSRLEHWRKHFEGLGARVDTSAWTLEQIGATLTRLQPSQVHALLGTTRKRGKQNDGAGTGSKVADTYEAVDYGLSIMLLEAALACGSNPRFVYLSALGADGRSVNAYMGVRKRVEAAIRGSGLPYLVVRPGFITGDDRDETRAAERVGAIVGDGLLGVLGALGAKRLQARYASLTGAQLGAAIVELACGAREHAELADTERLRGCL